MFNRRKQKEELRIANATKAAKLITAVSMNYMQFSKQLRQETIDTAVENIRTMDLEDEERLRKIVSDLYSKAYAAGKDDYKFVEDATKPIQR